MAVPKVWRALLLLFLPGMGWGGSGISPAIRYVVVSKEGWRSGATVWVNRSGCYLRQSREQLDGKSLPGVYKLGPIATAALVQIIEGSNIMNGRPPGLETTDAEEESIVIKYANGREARQHGTNATEGSDFYRVLKAVGSLTGSGSVDELFDAGPSGKPAVQGECPTAKEILSLIQTS